jgi:hypothetical protein
LSAGLASNLREAAKSPTPVISPEEADRLAANPNALIEPLARATLSPAKLHVLQDSLSQALRSVFRLGMIVSALSLLIVFRLPGKLISRAGEEAKPPPPKACDAKSGERLVIAELTTIDPDHEPSAGDED